MGTYNISLIKDDQGNLVLPLTSWKAVFNDDSSKNMAEIDAENVKLTGNQTIAGNKTFTGNVTLGDTSNDTVTVTSRIASDLVPSVTGTDSLGTSSLKWKDVYADGTISLTGDVTLGASGKTLSLAGAIDSDVIPNTTNANDLGSSTKKWKSVYATSFNGELSGNASTATKLAAGVNIGIEDADGTNTGTGLTGFDGSSGGTFKLPSTIKATLTGNAPTADKVNHALTVKLNNVQLGNTFDGSSAETINIPLAGTNVAAGLISNDAQTIAGEKTFSSVIQGTVRDANKVNQKLTVQLNGTQLGDQFDGSSAVTLNVPLAGTGVAAGLISNDTQTIVGNKTFDGAVSHTNDNSFTKAIYFNMGIPQYRLGDVGPGGGYVFYDAGKNNTSYYLDSNGNEQSFQWRYLEVSPSDITCVTPGGATINPPWGINYNGSSWDWVSINNLSALVGDGRYNSTKIVNQLGADFNGNYYDASAGHPKAGPGNYAPNLCLNYNGGGKSDWWLPSIEELKFIYANLHRSGIRSLTNSWYWSSSQFTSDGAWILLFFSGVLGFNGKYYNGYTRAVRGIVEA